MDRTTGIFVDGMGAAAATSGILNQLQGRIFALLYMVINGVTALPVLAAAALSDLIGTAHVIGGLGGLLIATAVAILTVGRRAIAPGPQ